MLFFNLYLNFKRNLCANIGQPGQTPHFVASDLVFHCLLMSHKKDARLKWVKTIGMLCLAVFSLSTVAQTVHCKLFFWQTQFFLFHHFHIPFEFLSVLGKVSKVAKIRNRYNQVPHLTQDTNGKVTNSQKTPQTRAKRSALSQQVTTKHI